MLNPLNHWLECTFHVEDLELLSERKPELQDLLKEEEEELLRLELDYLLLLLAAEADEFDDHVEVGDEEAAEVLSGSGEAHAVEHFLEDGEGESDRLDELFVLLVFLRLCHHWLLILVQFNGSIHGLHVLHDCVFEGHQVLALLTQAAFACRNSLGPLQNEELVQLAHILLDFLREVSSLTHLGVVGEASVLQQSLEELKDLLEYCIGARQSLDYLQYQFLNANPYQLLLIDLV